MAINNLGPAERFLVGAIGPPGKRRFYFQVVADGELHSMLAEKQQVQALATQGWRSLQQSGVVVDTDAVESLLSTDLEISDPHGDEDFRVGTINVGIRPSGLMNPIRPEGRPDPTAGALASTNVYGGCDTNGRSGSGGARRGDG